MANRHLSQAQIEAYSGFQGVYHDHTTHSDGEHTPDVMVETTARLGLDFLILTDHSRGEYQPVEGITGGLAAQDVVAETNIDLLVVAGAELSAVKHTTGWP